MHPVFRVGLLLLLGIVLLARGLEMLNDHITAASQPHGQARAAAVAAAVEAAEGIGPSPDLDAAAPALPSSGDLDDLPPDVAAAMDDRGDPRRRRAAIGTALALGAATKWPERVAAWVDDDDRAVRLETIRALAFGTDEATRLAGARVIAASAGDRDVELIAGQALAADLGLDAALADVAADDAEPAFARDQAAYLLSRRGGGVR